MNDLIQDNSDGEVVEFKVYGSVFERIKPPKKQKEKTVVDDDEQTTKISAGKKITTSQSGNNNNPQNIHYWNADKRWQLKRDIYGFTGKFKTTVDIIFKRDAYNQPEQLQRQLKDFIDALQRYNGRNNSLIGALEYGEQSCDDFKKSSTTPHYHFLIEGEISKAHQKKIKAMTGDNTCFDSVKIQSMGDERIARTYVAKSGRFKSKIKDGKKIVKWKETKGFNVPTKWENIRLQTRPKRGGYDSKVEADRVIYIDRELLTFFGNSMWNFWSGNRIKTKHLVSDGDVIKISDVEWSNYHTVELLWLIKKQLAKQMYDNGHKLDLEKLFSTESDIIIDNKLPNITGIVGDPIKGDTLDSFDEAFNTLNDSKDQKEKNKNAINDWFDKSLMKLEKLPPKYNAKLIFSFSEWIKIKRRYYDLKKTSVPMDDFLVSLGDEIEQHSISEQDLEEAINIASSDDELEEVLSKI